MTTCAPWATEADVCAPCDDYSFDPAILADWIQVASDALFEFTGHQWPGECSDTVWPGRRRVARDMGPPSQRGVFPGMVTTNRWPAPPCGCDREEFGCRLVPSIELPNYPVVEVVSVVIDGAELDPEFYEVADGRTLVRLTDSDGSNEGWPCCQRADLPDGSVGTWSVEYLFGEAPPLGGVKSAASLGCQLALACVGDNRCRLPKNIISATRQNASVQARPEPRDLFKDGRTGLPEVDLWLSSILVGKQRRRPVFGNPESLMRRAYRRRP